MSGGKGCQGHPVCLDFEDGSLTPAWEIGSGKDNKRPTVVKDKAAAGSSSLHFPDLLSTTNFSNYVFIRSKQLPAGLSNVLWGRAFLFIKDEAPSGHTPIVAAYDDAGNWYEVGIQYKKWHGNWHYPNGGANERWMDGDLEVPVNRWFCLEWVFDGAKPDITRIFADGTAVKFLNDAGKPGPNKVQKWSRVEIGFSPYWKSNTKEMWIDEVALASDRIGCGS